MPSQNEIQLSALAANLGDTFKDYLAEVLECKTTLARLAHKGEYTSPDAAYLQGQYNVALRQERHSLEDLGQAVYALVKNPPK